MDLREMVSAIENMTDGCQEVLLETLKEILYRQKGPAKIRHRAELDCIVNVGILVYNDGRYAIADNAKKKIRKLYTYLLRKFGVESCFDPNTGEMREIPKGAEFECTVSMDGSTTLELKFPDDDVTEMLNLFGTNRCGTWM